MAAGQRVDHPCACPAWAPRRTDASKLLVNAYSKQPMAGPQVHPRHKRSGHAVHSTRVNRVVGRLHLVEKSDPMKRRPVGSTVGALGDVCAVSRHTPRLAAQGRVLVLLAWLRDSPAPPRMLWAPKRGWRHMAGQIQPWLTSWVCAIALYTTRSTVWRARVCVGARAWGLARALTVLRS